jgi:surface polysaccharide O-acyltransferase-like enzyme
MQHNNQGDLKFDEISVMRTMAMTMIIAFHSVSFYGGRWKSVGSVMIPFWAKVMIFLDAIDLNMFVFISGYIYGYLYIYRNKYRHPSEVIRNKVIRLLLPYFIWGVFMLTVFPSLYTWHHLLYGISHLWFLLMLFGVFTLTVLLQLLNAQRVRFTRELGLLLIVIGFSSWYVSWKYVNPGDFLCATRVLYYFGAFMVGYLCAKLRIAWVMPGWACLALPIALVVLYALVRYSFPLSYSLLLFLKTLCAYVICMSLLIILGTITMKDRLRSIIQRVEQLSMGIYIFN